MYQLVAKSRLITSKNCYWGIVIYLVNWSSSSTHFLILFNYMYVHVQVSESKWYHYLFIFNRNISDIVRKCDIILEVAIFIFNISFENFNYVFAKIMQWGATIWNNNMCRISWLRLQKKILTSAKLRSSCYKKIYLLKLKLSVHLCTNFLFSSIILTSVWQGMIFLSQPQNESLKGPPRLGLWRKKEDSKNGWGSRQGLTHVNVLFVTNGIFLG